MSRYTPPEQEQGRPGFRYRRRGRRHFRGAVAAAETGPCRSRQSPSTRSTAKTWETLGQNPTMAAIWEKLGYTPETAHDIIQNRFHYVIDWPTLIIMAAVLIGYFVFLFRASDREYRDVINEKFDDK